ncbi:VOC family protein [Aestuariibius sp. HNIBRBA575]|uniref:VOC family protein n=1 Tax=Aestuariibius sp. HNIBRBA575 TaxID=3233343 RepID=UPI0034A5799F
MSSMPIVVWTEIPVSKLDSAISFYNEVFNWDMQINTDSPNPTAVLGGRMDTVAGSLFEGTPGTGTVIHIAVPDTLEATRDRCTAAGGKVTSDIVTLPVGRFVYASDPDGNALGLFEVAA